MKSLFRVFVLMVSIITITNQSIAQWVKTLEPVGGVTTCFADKGTNIFVGIIKGGVFVSTNNGLNWVSKNTGLTTTNIRSLAVWGESIFVGTYDDGVFQSKNNGENWTPFNKGLPDVDLPYKSIQALAVNSEYIFAGTYGVGAYRSTNNIDNWIEINKGMSAIYSYVMKLVISDNNIFAGTRGYGGMFRSSDNGINWTVINTNLTYTLINDLVVSGSNLFVATDGGGVFRSTNNGESWTHVNDGLTDNYIYSLAINSTNIFAGCYYGVFILNNNGTNWFPVNTGLAEKKVIRALTISGSFLFAGTDDGTIWRRPLAEMVTAVDEHAVKMPISFNLEQNYPNPFNPTTHFGFHIAKRGMVALKVYDMLGREVAVLASEMLPAGSYSRQWNAASFPSGIYFYRLQAGNYIATKKLILLK